MKHQLKIRRASPLATIQDEGRIGHLSDGISASGPMDRAAFHKAALLLDGKAGAALEFTTAGIAFKYKGEGDQAAFTGGDFNLQINGKPAQWNASHQLKHKDIVDITPGKSGNYGYVRLNSEIDVPLCLGSRATNMIVSLGGHEGRALKLGDKLKLVPTAKTSETASKPGLDYAGPIRFIWGVHSEHFDNNVRASFVSEGFKISTKLNRMGIRLDDEASVFAQTKILSLVSDAVVPGDIQILGDGTPIILMRDHQPTGGYPRIGTVISADMNRLAQMRPGTIVEFEPIGVAKARAFAKDGR